jgi:thiamine transport system permease protein
VVQRARERSARLWHDSYLWHVIRFSFWQAFLSALLSAIPAIFLRARFIGGVFPADKHAAPVRHDADPARAGGGIWYSQRYGRQGWLASLFTQLGLEWSFSPYGLQGILLAHVFFNMPMARASFAGAGEHSRRAAPDCRPARHARLVVLPFVEWPWLRRQIPPVAALIFMLCFASFATVLSLGGGPQATTIELAIYQALSYDYDPGRAALLAIVQMAAAWCWCC